jgi:magnesium-transporting ATPase (P-type)
VHGPSITWQGVFGTRAVLIGIAFVTVAQFTLTYLPFMHTVFRTAPVSLHDGLLIVAVGVVVPLLVELEKRVVARLAGATNAPLDALESKPSSG